MNHVFTLTLRSFCLCRFPHYVILSMNIIIGSIEMIGCDSYHKLRGLLIRHSLLLKIKITS